METTTHSVLQRIAESRKYGTCKRCGKRALLYYGTGYCEECAEELWQERQGAERKAHVLDYQRCLIKQGMLSEETPDITFATSKQTPENQEVITKLQAWNGKTNIYLFGPPGVGKSHLGRCLINQAAWDGKTISEVTTRAALKLGMTFHDKGGFRAISRVQVLLLDDIDKGGYNEERLGVLWELLDIRSRNHGRTVVTSNVNPTRLASDLARRVPENTSYARAALDRLKPIEVYEMKGVSLR